MGATTGRVTVRRPNGGYRDLSRSYRIDVDDVACGVVARGGEVAIEVEPGRHAVRARIDWTGSPTIEVEVASGEETVLRVEPAGGAVQFYQALSKTRYLKLTPLK